MLEQHDELDFICSLAGISPARSIGSPNTLNTRPNVTLPTGTEIGEPVSINFHTAH